MNVKSGLLFLAFIWGFVGYIVGLGVLCYQVAEWTSDEWGYVVMVVVPTTTAAGFVAWTERS